MVARYHKYLKYIALQYVLVTVVIQNSTIQYCTCTISYLYEKTVVHNNRERIIILAMVRIDYLYWTTIHLIHSNIIVLEDWLLYLRYLYVKKVRYFACMYDTSIVSNTCSYQLPFCRFPLRKDDTVHYYCTSSTYRWKFLRYGRYGFVSTITARTTKIPTPQCLVTRMTKYAT